MQLLKKKYHPETAYISALQSLCEIIIQQAFSDSEE